MLRCRTEQVAHDDREISNCPRPIAVIRRAVHHRKGLRAVLCQCLKHTACVVRVWHVIRKRTSFRLQQCIFASLDDGVRRRRLSMTPLMKEVRAEQRLSDSSKRTPASQPCGTWGVGMNLKLCSPVDKRSSLVKTRAGLIEKSFTLTRALTKPHTGCAAGASSSQ